MELSRISPFQSVTFIFSCGKATGLVDKDGTQGVLYLDFSKLFSLLLKKIFISKIEEYKLPETS